MIVGLAIRQGCLHFQTSVPLGASSGTGALRSALSTGGVSGTGALPSALWTGGVSGAGALPGTSWTGGVSPTPFTGESSSSVEHLFQSSTLLYSFPPLCIKCNNSSSSIIIKAFGVSGKATGSKLN